MAIVIDETKIYGKAKKVKKKIQFLFTSEE